MLEAPLLQLSSLRVHHCDLLKLGVEIYAYNDHRSAPFSRACWLVSTTNFTRASEPTLSWNQLHSLTPDRGFECNCLITSVILTNNGCYTNYLLFLVEILASPM